MAKNEEKDDNNTDETNNLAKFTGIAFQMIAVIGIFAFAGHKIDAAENNAAPWFTAILSLTGVLISMYIIIKSLKN